jgi:ribosomal protein S18 acetylase RimI-like enzyme
MADTDVEATPPLPDARLYAFTPVFTSDVWGPDAAGAGEDVRRMWDCAQRAGFSGMRFPDEPDEAGIQRPAHGLALEDSDQMLVFVVHDVAVLALRLSGRSLADLVTVAYELLGDGADGGLRPLYVAVRTDVPPPASLVGGDVRRWVSGHLPPVLAPVGGYTGAAAGGAADAWWVDAHRSSRRRSIAAVLPPDRTTLDAVDDVCWFNGPVPGDLLLYAALSGKLGYFEVEGRAVLGEIASAADAVDAMRRRFDRQAQDLKLRAGRGSRAADLDGLVEHQLTEEHGSFEMLRVDRYTLDDFDENLHRLYEGVRLARQRLVRELGADVFEEDELDLEVLVGDVAHQRGRMQRSLELLRDTNQLRNAEVARLELRLDRDRGRLQQIQTSIIGAAALVFTVLQTAQGGPRVALAAGLGALGFVVPLLVIDLEDPYTAGHVLAVATAIVVAAVATIGYYGGWLPALIAGVVLTAATIATVRQWGTALGRLLDRGIRGLNRWWVVQTRRVAIERAVDIGAKDELALDDLYHGTIRRAQREPFDAIVADVRGHRRRAWVGRLEGAIAGLIVARTLPAARAGVIEYVCVDERWQGLGIGARLVSAARDDLMTEGGAELVVAVVPASDGRDPAEDPLAVAVSGLFEGQGFARARLRVPVRDRAGGNDQWAGVLVATSDGAAPGAERVHAAVNAALAATHGLVGADDLTLGPSGDGDGDAGTSHPLPRPTGRT